MPTSTPPSRAFRTLGRAFSRSLAALALLLPLAAFTPTENLFAPSSDLWDRWQRHDPQSELTLDFTAWDRLLETYVTQSPQGNTLFDYAAVTEADKAALAGFLERQAAVPISRHARPQQMAYWINLYNALTVQVVLEHFPVSTIRDIDISPGFFSDGPWDKEVIRVEGEDLTLNDIEHRILRPIWMDPRIHYAVNCASIGCPDLRADSYRAEELDRQLDDAARRYVNDPRGVSIEGGRVTVSKIYDWFYEDFGRNPESLLMHLKRYAEPELARRLKEIGEIHDTDYDWDLNAAGSTS